MAATRLEQPTGEQPTGEQPTGERPTGERPTGERPTGERPTGERPTGEQPTGESAVGRLAAGPITDDSLRATDESLRPAEVSLRTADLIGRATDLLRRAGIDGASVDAQILLAHVLGMPRSRLSLASPGPEAARSFDRLVRRRSVREPLQHLTGEAPFRYRSLLVGQGVFIPRPETELLVDAVLVTLAGASSACGEPPVVVDLCSGSGAIALSVLTERPDVIVHAVERDAQAFGWLMRNVEALPSGAARRLHVHCGDAADALQEMNAGVDVVVANPPYLPEGTDLPPEVADYDPPVALFGGPDGLDGPRMVATAARRLLRGGGALVLEHAESHGAAVRTLLADAGGWNRVRTHPDLCGRPRYSTARRMAEAESRT